MQRRMGFDVCVCRMGGSAGMLKSMRRMWLQKSVLVLRVQADVRMEYI
jgi:hypothetical protein